MNEHNKYLAVDSRLNLENCKKLESYGYNLIKIPIQSCLDEPVSAHPDMSLLKLGNVLFITDGVKDLFTNVQKIEVVGKSQLENKLNYPDDVYLNCAVVGNKLICNEKYIHSTVLDYAKNIGYEIVNVKQGYAKCSTCVISHNAIITEDNSIANGCAKAGIDVLKISKSFVRLDGYNYGFIGGCSGLIEDKLVVFNGNIFLHPDGKLIQEFCNKHGVRFICLCKDELYDVGSIIRL